MMTRGLRSLSGALVVALSVLTSAGCGGGKKEPSPLEQWREKAGAPRHGVVLASRDIGQEWTKSAEQEVMPARPLRLCNTDGFISSGTVRYGFEGEELSPPVRLDDPQLLATISSARGIKLSGDLDASIVNSDTGYPLFRLAIMSRHSAGIPIAASLENLGDRLGDSEHQRNDYGSKEARFNPPAFDFWPEGYIPLPHYEAGIHLWLIDDFAVLARPYVVLLTRRSAVLIDQSNRRLSAKGEDTARLLDFTDAKTSRKGRQVENVRLSILHPGDAFDLAERRVRFAAGKTIHGSTTTLPMEKYENATDPDTVLEMAARLADSAPGSTLAADFGPDGTLILTRDAETLAFRPLVKGDGEKNSRPEIKLGPDTPWTISRLRLDILPTK